MPYQFPVDVNEQLRECLDTGYYATEEDVLREAFRAVKRQHDDVAAIREAMADLEAGDRGRSFDEFVAEFRARA